MNEKRYPCGTPGCNDPECTVDPPEGESKFKPGTAERRLADHLDREGFGGWVNVDEIVDEVKRMGWNWSPIGKIDADNRSGDDPRSSDEVAYNAARQEAAAAIRSLSTTTTEEEK